MIRHNAFIFLVFFFCAVSGFQISPSTPKVKSDCYQNNQWSDAKQVSVVLGAEPPQDDNEKKLKLPKIGMPSMEDNQIIPLVLTVVAFVIIQKVGLMAAEKFTPEISVEAIQQFGENF
mmetsp:Transcript_3597/g.3025  ORF Transcript_3597/g.3025 Transcript_3597/m.3025 type:complete len:118 (-) Transcript_3597:57-410(-)